MCFPKPRAAEQVQAGTLPRGETRRIIFAVFQYLGHMLPGREAKLRHQCIRIFFQRERLEGAQRERGRGVHLLLAQLPHQPDGPHEPPAVASLEQPLPQGLRQGI